MNKWKILNSIICIGYFILSIICGMTIYLFLCYASFEIFPSGFNHVLVNIGAVGLMFYVHYRVYRFFDVLYSNVKKSLKLLKSQESIKGLKSKIVKILSPEEDWINAKKK